MSVILDALRRKTEQSASRGAKTPRPDSVLATLGYSTQRGRDGWSWKTLLTYGAVAILLGFLAVALPVYLLAPRPGAQEGDAPTTPPQPLTGAPARGVALGPSAAETPGTPAAPPPSTEPLQTARPPATAPTQPSVTRVEPASSVASGTPSPSPAPSRTANLGAAAAGASSRRAPVAQPSAETGPADRSTLQAEPRQVPTPGEQPPPDHFGLALYYQRAGDFANALAQYRLTLERNDASAEVHNNLGILYQDAGDSVAAAEHFRRAIAIDPRHVSAHNNLGVAYLREGRLEEAVSQFTISLGADDRNVESLVNLGLVHQAGGRPVEARTLLQQAVDIAPRHPGSHYNLAVVADEEGDVATAVEHYRAFLRFGTVVHPELAPLVRARLSEIASQ